MFDLPDDLDGVREMIYAAGGGRDDIVPVPPRVWRMIRALEGATGERHQKERELYRRRFLQHVFGVPSTKRLNTRQLYALVCWCEGNSPQRLAALMDCVEEIVARESGQLSLFSEYGVK